MFTVCPLTSVHSMCTYNFDTLRRIINSVNSIQNSEYKDLFAMNTYFFSSTAETKPKPEHKPEGQPLPYFL